MRLNRYKMGLNQDRSNTKIVGGGGGGRLEKMSATMVDRWRKF